MKKDMQCKCCKSKITECGGDSFGHKYFKCECSEWKSKNGNSYFAFAKYDGKGIERMKHE